MTELNKTVLLKAREFLSVKDKWTQGVANDSDGRCCLGGAITKAAGGHPENMYYGEYGELLDRFAEVAGLRTEREEPELYYEDSPYYHLFASLEDPAAEVVEFNDSHDYEEVIGLLDRVIESWEE